MQLSLSADTLLCYADANANAYINVLNNGILPFNYLWSDGQITDSAFNLNSGLYDLTITDDNNCSVTSTVEVTEPDAYLSLLSITFYIMVMILVALVLVMVLFLLVQLEVLAHIYIL